MARLRQDPVQARPKSGAVNQSLKSQNEKKIAEIDGEECVAKLKPKQVVREAPVVAATGKLQRSLKPDGFDSLLKPAMKTQMVHGSVKASARKMEAVRATPGRAAKSKRVLEARRESADSTVSGSSEDSEFEHESECTTDASCSDESECDSEVEVKRTTVARSKISRNPPSSKPQAKRRANLDPKPKQRQPPTFDLAKGLNDLTLETTTNRPSSRDSDHENATIRFSPSTSPTRKAPHPFARPATPPAQPASPSKNKLASPRKLINRIPPTPGHRPSLDAFWSVDEVSAWNEQYSPQKPLKSIRKFRLSADVLPVQASLPISSPSCTPPPPKSRNVVTARSPHKPDSFLSTRAALAEEFLALLDTRLTSNRLSSLTESTGGIKLIWSSTLRSSAGRAHWRRETLSTTPSTYSHHATIDLATKIIDDPLKLYSTLAHEFCHLADYMLSVDRKTGGGGHGPSFKAWGAKADAAFGGAPWFVHVTTKHSYEIDFRYEWACAACGVVYKRHSRSIDPRRQRCGKCKGALEQTKPKPRGGGNAAGGGEGGGAKTSSAYAAFVKMHFKSVQAAMGPKSPMKDVMKEVGVRYRAEKERAVVAVDEVAVEGEEVDSEGEGEGEDEVDAVARKLAFTAL